MNKRQKKKQLKKRYGGVVNIKRCKVLSFSLGKTITPYLVGVDLSREESSSCMTKKNVKE